jgi:uncharacterized repeat protein (TIGR03803 family)
MSFARSTARHARLQQAARLQAESLEQRVLLSSYLLDTLTPLGTNTTGGQPRAGLTIDANGNLFGTTSVGGTFGFGTVFEIPHGSSNLVTLASFGGADGANPFSNLVLDSSGNLYGATYNGGANNVGAVFEIVRGSANVTLLASFTTYGNSPSGNMVIDSSGNLYGTTQGGSGNGEIFELPRGSATIRLVGLNLPGTGSTQNGVSPEGGVVMDSAGNLYGTAESGGYSGYGSVFELPQGSTAINVVASFNGASQGGNPVGGLVLDSNGNLYGTTSKGGQNGDGTVFEIQKGSATITTLAGLAGTNGASPHASLFLDASGDLYGTASTSTNATGYNGTVFELPHGSSTLNTIAILNGPLAGVGGLGSDPEAGVVMDSAGNFFGTTCLGGNFNTGSVYEIANGSSTAAPIVLFTPISGSSPDASLTIDSSGNIYGTADAGGYIPTIGGATMGTVFEIPHGASTASALVTFVDDQNIGGNPNGPLLRDKSGTLYGWTQSGGAGSEASIFRIDSDGSTITRIASIFGTPTGLALDTNGNLFGTTLYGGIFEIPAGATQATNLAPLSNQFPSGNIVVDANGNVFGTTQAHNGANGAIYELPAGATAASTLATFDGANGSVPIGGVIFDSSGDIFGTTSSGGANGDGTIFELPHGSSTIMTLASFNGANGSDSQAPLLLDASGNLYGTCAVGGAYNDGTVFELPNGSSVITTLVSFDGANGLHPYGGVVLDGHGNLYGTTSSGGINDWWGTIFELSPDPMNDVINATSGTNQIVIRQDPDHHNIDWAINGGTPSLLPVNDPNGLSINGNGGNDTITLDYTNGNPLPATLHLNGTFTINGLQGTNPLASSTLEIGRSTVFISYSSADPIAAIQGYLHNGYNNGAWNGTPTATTGVITSAAAQANPNHNTAIGYADSADGQGVNATPNTIELTYTLFGDTNLDHQVNSADLQILLFSLNRPGAWDQGDFNYDGQVNSADLQNLLFTLNTSLGSQATPMAIDATAAVTTPPSAGSPGSSDPSPRLVPAIHPTGTTGPVVHPPHAAKLTARKRR